jgi:hypothetical protein
LLSFNNNGSGVSHVCHYILQAKEVPIYSRFIRPTPELAIFFVVLLQQFRNFSNVPFYSTIFSEQNKTSCGAGVLKLQKQIKSHTSLY